MTLTCPAGIGRERVRSTLASRSRSVISFQVQPAPRMTKAPTKNNAMFNGSGRRSRAVPAASAADHQQGINSSHDPIGRSRRESRRYGRNHSGARVSTQLPVASATRAAAPLIGYRASTLPFSVSNVVPPLFLAAVASGNAADDPSTSLRLGPAGPLACWVAASQTFFWKPSVFL